MMDNTQVDNDSHEQHESIEEYLPVFLNEYDVKSVDQVNCVVVSDTDFEKLGDAVMESNHPGSAHTNMDQMMGGEGSENLKQMHINMGKSYLGCINENSNGGFDTNYMMARNHVGYGMSGMSSGFTYLWGINSLLVSVLLIVLIRYFWKKTK